MSRALVKGKPSSFAVCLLTDLTENACSFDLHHKLEIYGVCKLPFRNDSRVHNLTNIASGNIIRKGRIFAILWLMLRVHGGTVG
jgi:hypothetical protein